MFQAITTALKQLAALIGGSLTSSKGKGLSKKAIILKRNRERIKRVIAHQHHVEQAKAALTPATMNVSVTQQHNAVVETASQTAMPPGKWVDKMGRVHVDRRGTKTDRRRYKRNRRRARSREK